MLALHREHRGGNWPTGPDAMQTCRDENPPWDPHEEGRVLERLGLLSSMSTLRRDRLGVQPHSWGRGPSRLLLLNVLHSHTNSNESVPPRQEHLVEQVRLSRMGCDIDHRTRRKQY